MSDRSLEDIEPDQLESNYDKTIVSFDGMHLESQLLHDVYEYGFECPSAIQQRAIMPVIQGGKGNDIIAEAPSATGKTTSLCISAVQLVDNSIKTCQALILASSFDVAQRIQSFTVAIGRSKQINCPVSAGRVPIHDNINALHKGQQIVIGTPGRVLDLIRLGAITIGSTKRFVLDGADEMLSCGFTEHILAIHRLLPVSTQSVFLSITMPHDVLEMATRLLRDPLHIALKSRTGHPLNGIKQLHIAVEKEDQKPDVLFDLIKIHGAAQAVIFCNRRRTVEWLAEQLSGRGLTASAMHADMSAIERAAILGDFRSGSTRILLATNLLARGIDAQPVLLVVNYDLPTKHEDYIHRTSSRTCSKREAIVINLTTTTDLSKIHHIEHYYNTHIEETSISLLSPSQFSDM